MMRMNPSPPLGAYPQLRLCGQEGSAPSTIRTSMTSRIEPIDIIFSFRFTDDTLATNLRCLMSRFGSVGSEVEQAQSSVDGTHLLWGGTLLCYGTDWGNANHIIAATG